MAAIHDKRCGICPPTVDRPPINLGGLLSPPDFSGFIIVRLSGGAVSRRARTLDALAEEFRLSGLAAFLKRHRMPSRRLITSVPVERLLRIEESARRTAFFPLRSLALYWRLDARTSLDPLESLLTELARLHEVELAYRERSVTEPQVNAADDPFSASQNYLDAAPTGIDARWAWTQANGDGVGMRFIDLEQGWFLSHEDLPGPTLIFNSNRDGVGSYKGNHGTAVLGEVAGVDNTRGIVGIAPNINSVRVVSHFEAAGGTDLHVADAIVAAVAAAPPPHVLLLEVQRGSLLLPTETDDGDFDAIRLSVATGVVVVEAGGNGGNDLDTWTDVAGLARLNRMSSDFRDSGAILVGAASSASPHERLSFSNFGSRVDCYGWGQAIVTAGYGDLSAGTGDASTYTSTFGGTSGASPIVSGAALIVQGLYAATTGSLLSPGQIRAVLSAPATGTAQGMTVAGAIGVMPDLRQIIQTGLGLVPDVYLRDALGDSGVVPDTGPVSVSPDVIVRPAPVADPTASFGEGSGTENDDTLGSRIEQGQDNHIYVRLRNRGTAPAAATTATVYWSEVATLITPDMWNRIGTTAPAAVPVGDTLIVTGPVLWPKASLPPVGDHACFVVVVDDPRDPAPPTPPSTVAFDWTAFANFIRNNNNVAWRNFEVVDVLPDPAADPAVLDFLLVGAPDQAREFDFEIQQQLPAGARAWLEVPPAMLATLPREPFGEVALDRKSGRVRLPIPCIRRLAMCGVRLPANAKLRCRLVVHGGKGLGRGVYRVALRQIYDGLEVGRVTLGIRAKPRKTAQRPRKAKRRR